MAETSRVVSLFAWTKKNIIKVAAVFTWITFAWTASCPIDKILETYAVIA